MERILLLDGGTGHELKQRGIVTDGSFLAGMFANEQQPEAVSQVHRDFLRAGCNVITTNSFVAIPQRIREDLTTSMAVLDASEHSDEEFSRAIWSRTLEFVSASVKCARHAIATVDEAGSPTFLIAGCVPPLYECYKPELIPQDTARLTADYRRIIHTLWDEGVDILLAETMSTTREALAVIRAVDQVRASKHDAHAPTSKGHNGMRPQLFLSFTLHDDLTCRLRSGESLSSAVSECFACVTSINDERKRDGGGTTLGIEKQSIDEDIVAIDCIGVNCSSPPTISAAVALLANEVPTLATTHRLPATPRVLAYGNAFQTTTSEWLESLTGEDDTDGKSDRGKDNAAAAVHDDKDVKAESAAASATEIGDTPSVRNSHRDMSALPSVDKEDFDAGGCILPEAYCRHVKQWVDSGATVVGGCCGCSPSHMKAVSTYLRTGDH